MSMKLPVPTSELLDFIPHRPPMVWIDFVDSYSESGGSSRTILVKEGFYFTDEQLRRSVCIELVAQAFAFNNAALLKASGLSNPPIKRAFLAAIKDFKITEWPTIPVGAVLKTTVKKSRQFGPITLISGETYLDETLLASGELKVFAE